MLAEQRESGVGIVVASATMIRLGMWCVGLVMGRNLSEGRGAGGGLSAPLEGPTESGSDVERKQDQRGRGHALLPTANQHPVARNSGWGNQPTPRGLQRVRFLEACDTRMSFIVSVIAMPSWLSAGANRPNWDSQLHQPS